MRPEEANQAFVRTAEQVDRMRELIAKFEREAQEARERAQKLWEEEQRAVAAAKGRGE